MVSFLSNPSTSKIPVLWMAAAMVCLVLPVANAELSETHTVINTTTATAATNTPQQPVVINTTATPAPETTNAPQQQQQQQQQQPDAITTSPTAVENTNTGCLLQKKVRLALFLTRGQTSFADFTDHGYYLNGNLFPGDDGAVDVVEATNEFSPAIPYTEDDSAVVDAEPMVSALVDPNEELRVGLAESDDFHEESLSYSLPPDYWYSDSCRRYDILLVHAEANHEWIGCWLAGDPTEDDAIDFGLALEPCADLPTIPTDSMAWVLRVEPGDDNGSGIPAANDSGSINSNSDTDPSIGSKEQNDNVPYGTTPLLIFFFFVAFSTGCRHCCKGDGGYYGGGGGWGGDGGGACDGGGGGCD